MEMNTMQNETLSFEANFEDTEFGFKCPPAGDYACAITNATYAPTKDGNGKLLTIEYTIIEGSQQGQKIYDRLCLVHEKPSTQKMSISRFNAVLKAIGVRGFKHQNELLNKTLRIKTRVAKSKDERYGDQAVIDEYIPMNAGGFQQQVAQNVQQPSQPTTGVQGNQPWQQKMGM
jgi:hypothetical protein